MEKDTGNIPENNNDEFASPGGWLSNCQFIPASELVESDSYMLYNSICGNTYQFYCLHGKTGKTRFLSHLGKPWPVGSASAKED